MRIEFGLPQGAGGMAAQHESASLRTKLKQWSEQYQVLIIVASDRHDYRHWLTVDFKEEKDLTLFALTWTHRSFMSWKLARDQ